MDPSRIVPPLSIGFLVCSVLLISIPRLEAAADELEETVSWWDQSYDLRTGAGYSDNLSLSRAAEEESPYIFGGLDYTLLRLPLDGKQFTLFLSAEYIRYLEGQEVKDEVFGLAVMRYKIDLAPTWQVGVDAQYLYQDQVLDTSITETNSGPTGIQGHGINVRPSLRHDWGKNFWLEGSVGTTRQFYHEPLDDYWEAGPQVILGLDYGFKSSISASYSWLWRDYDRREEVTQDGFGLPGTSLQFQHNEMDLVLRHHFESERRWRWVTRLGFLWNKDNGSGYFDFVRYQLSQELRYVARLWEISGRVKFAHYDFRRQPVGGGDSSARHKDLVAATLRGERKLFAQVKLFAEYAFERSLSNRSLDEYQVNKISGGVDWEF